MKWMIASDIHGSALFCQQMIQAYRRERADRLLLLGDLRYHGPRNDLPEQYNPKTVIALLNPLAADILCVRGNCDAEVDQMVLDFPIQADCCILSAGRRMIFATHGHLYNPDQPPALHPGDVLLTGHTHVPACQARAGYTYCNPGSVSLPKSDSAAGYMTLQDQRLLWKDLSGNILRQYDLD